MALRLPDPCHSGARCACSRQKQEQSPDVSICPAACCSPAHSPTQSTRLWALECSPSPHPLKATDTSHCLRDNLQQAHRSASWLGLLFQTHRCPLSKYPSSTQGCPSAQHAMHTLPLLVFTFFCTVFFISPFNNVY